MEKKTLAELTAQIVSAHAAGCKEMSTNDLLAEMDAVHAKLKVMAGSEDPAAAVPELPRPAIPMAKAFGTEQVFCMECGKGFSTLKKHLVSAHGISGKEYKKKHGIPASVKLVAKSYSKARKTAAIKLGLGDKLRAGHKKWVEGRK